MCARRFPLAMLWLLTPGRYDSRNSCQSRAQKCLWLGAGSHTAEPSRSCAVPMRVVAQEAVAVSSSSPVGPLRSKGPRPLPPVDEFWNTSTSASSPSGLRSGLSSPAVILILFSHIEKGVFWHVPSFLGLRLLPFNLPLL